MSGKSSGKVMIIRSADVSLKINDVTEGIISEIMNSGTVDVVGVEDAIFLVCSALNLSCEIAKIYLNHIEFGYIEDPQQGKAAAIFVHLAQQESVDYEKLVEEEEKLMDNIVDRTVSVGHEIPLEKLVTRSLMALARFDEIKLIAAGGSINEAVSLALKLSEGKITREPVGAKLIYLHSINMRNDPAKRISAISIYLKKGITAEPTDFLKKLKSEVSK
jgi:DNA-binding protein